jgi:hypothetical protein
LWSAQRLGIDFDGHAAVFEPVEQGIDEGFVGEQVIPFFLIEVGGDDGGLAAVAFAHEFEEGIALFGFQGQVAQFVTSPLGSGHANSL